MTSYEKIYSDPMFFDCLTGTIASMCSARNLNFEKMFIENWSFQLIPSEANGLIGGSLIFNNNVYANLKKYYGIDVAFSEYASTQEYECEIKKRLRTNTPFALFYDPYFASWLPTYNVSHNWHASLVCGYENDQLILEDVIPFLQNIRVGLKDLPVSTLKLIDIHSQTSCSSSNIPELNQYYEQIHNQIYTTPISMFDTMRIYSNRIQSEFDIEKENVLKGTNAWVSAPFLQDLENISRSRRNFSLSLKSICEEYNDKNIKNLQQKMESISAMWYQLWITSWKFFLAAEYNESDIKQDLSTAINQIIGHEEATALKFFKSVEVR